MSDIRIRMASPADARLLASLGERTFREAFGSSLEPSDLSQYLSDAFTEKIILGDLSERRCRYVLALKGKSPVGYAKLFAGNAPECVKFHPNIELCRFYVVKACWGHGVGDILMGTCLQWAGDNGYAVLWLSTWQLNHRANAFYRRQKFRIAGEKTFVVGKEVQEDFILVRPLVERLP